MWFHDAVWSHHRHHSRRNKTRIRSASLKLIETTNWIPNDYPVSVSPLEYTNTNPLLNADTSTDSSHKSSCVDTTACLDSPETVAVIQFSDSVSRQHCSDHMQVAVTWHVSVAFTFQVLLDAVKNNNRKWSTVANRFCYSLKAAPSCMKLAATCSQRLQDTSFKIQCIIIEATFR